MSKNKLEKFSEMAEFKNVIQPVINRDELLSANFYLKNLWGEEFFSNNNPITLELGCGKGEYCLGLATNYPNQNFIGVDIKGARIWNGASKALAQNINNVGFLRTRIDMIDVFFGENEVDEIWITFPDPQRKKQNKRLTSAYFLNLYRKFVKDNGVINLKTDSYLMHYYTLELLKANGIKPEIYSNDIYNKLDTSGVLSIKTFYESMFLKEGRKITYIKFRLPKQKQFVEIDKFVWDGDQPY